MLPDESSSPRTEGLTDRPVRDAGRRRPAPRDRRGDRRQRPPRGRRPVPRRGRGGARVRGEPGLRRRRAARPDQLPQLRQPREAAHRLAAHARRRRAWATPAARSACPSSAATSRSTTRAAAARSTRRRSSGSSASCPTRAAPAGSASPARATPWRSSPPTSWAPSAAASELAKLRGEPIEGPLPAADLGELRTLHAAIRPAVRAGALTSAHDVAEGGVAIAMAECCIAGGIGARVDLDGIEPLRRGSGRVRRLRARARRSTALGAAARIIGEVGGDVAGHGRRAPAARRGADARARHGLAQLPRLARPSAGRGASCSSVASASSRAGTTSRRGTPAARAR